MFQDEVVDRAPERRKRRSSRSGKHSWTSTAALQGCSVGRGWGMCSSRGLGNGKMQFMGPGLALSDHVRVLLPADLNPRQRP
jgi:hypothetical protein